MKKLLLLFLVLLQITLARAQDNIFSKKSPKGDTSVVLNYVIEGSKIKTSKPDSCLLLAEKGLMLSRQIQYLRGEALCLNLAGFTFSTVGDFPKAFDMFLQALKIAEKLPNPKAKGQILNNIGDLYFKQQEYRQSLNYIFQAQQISEQLKDSKNLLINLSNIGNNYEALNMLDSARYYTQSSYNLAEKLKDENQLGVALNNLGNIQWKMKQLNLALEYYKLSIPYFQKTEDSEGLCESTLGLAKVFQEKSLLDSGRYYATLSANIGKQGGFTNYVFRAANFLTDFYKKQNKIDSAFYYQEISIAAKDSMFSQEKVKQVQNIALRETLRQQELAQEKARAIVERKQNLQYLGIAAFIFLFTLFVILIAKRRTKSTTVNFMITLVLLLFFEFISLYLHPYIGEWTHHTPIYMLAILVVIASFLAPLHHKFEQWIKEYLAHKIVQPKIKKMVVKKHIVE